MAELPPQLGGQWSGFAVGLVEESAGPPQVPGGEEMKRCPTCHDGHCASTAVCFPGKAGVL